MKSTQRQTRISRVNFSSRSSTMGALSEYKTASDIDVVIKKLDDDRAANKISAERYNITKEILLIRKKALQGESTLPPEGTIKVTKSCIISRLGGNIIITFDEEASSQLRSACEIQGFSFTTAKSCTAGFTTARYIFALELCSGYEQVDSGLDVEGVTNVISRYMQSNKVGFENLSDDVKEAIKSVPQTIMLQTSPDTPPVDASDVSDIPDFYKIVDDVLMGHNVFLVGPAGSGKTFLAEKVAEKLKRLYVTINCSQYTSPTEIKGGPTIEGYQEGALIDCWENGKILILDELPKIDPNTAGLLNEALAKTKVRVGTERAVIYNGRNEPKSKKEGFGVIATGNVWPSAESAQYSANSRQDLSLLDRFSGSVFFVGFNDKLELRQAGSELVYSIGMRLRKWILDNRVDSTISLRWLETAASVYATEMGRLKGERTDAELLDIGKTLKDHVDAVISTFNVPQQENLRAFLNYDNIFSTYQYRKMASNLEVMWD